MQYLLDEPIIDESQDLLKRGKFVYDFVQNIFSIPKEKNMVLAINGSWGSGKTSLINLIKKELEKAFVDIKRSNSDLFFVKVLDFAPWNVSDVDSIIKQFFNLLISNFSESKIKKIIDSDIFDSITDNASRLPNIGPFVKAVRTLLKKYVNSFLTGNENLLEIKEKLENKMKDINFKFVVFIDDIDRLNKKEIKMIIQLIKAVCNFPNIIYVLSFDKNIVAAALNEEQGVSGYEYLEKIVQMSVNIPEIDDYCLMEYLSNKIINTINFKKIKYDDYRLHYVFNNGLSKYFNTFRNINRYINTIAFKAERYLKEVDFVDFLALEAISLFEPKLLEEISNNREMLCSDLSVQKETIEKFKQTIDKISDNYILLTYLFPVLYDSNISYYSDDMTNECRMISGRICTRKTLDFYFNGDLNCNYLFNDDIKSFLELKDPSERKKFLTKLNKESFSYLLHYVKNYFTDLEEIDLKYLDVLNDIIEFGKTFKKNNYSLFGDYNINISMIIIKILLASNDKEEFYSKMINIYETNSNYELLIRLIQAFTKNTGFLEPLILNETDDNNYKYLDEEKILRLYNILINRLKIYIFDINNIDNSNLVKIIQFMNYRDSQIVSDWFNFLLKENNIFRVIRNFYFVSNDLAKRWYKSYIFNFKDLQNHLDINDLKTKLKAEINKKYGTISIGEALFLFADHKKNKYYKIEELEKLCKKEEYILWKLDYLDI